MIAIIFTVATLAAFFQCLLWMMLLKEFMHDSADREDVFLLIPGAWIVLGIWYVVKGIPAALKREVRR